MCVCVCARAHARVHVNASVMFVVLVTDHVVSCHLIYDSVRMRFASCDKS